MFPGPPDLKTDLVAILQPPNPPNPPTQVQRQLCVDELAGPSGSPVVQLVPNSPPRQVIEHSMVESQSDELYFKSTNITPEPGINHPLHKSFDPLQLELEIIKKYKEEAIKAHEDTVCPALCFYFSYL